MELFLSLMPACCNSMRASKILRVYLLHQRVLLEQRAVEDYASLYSEESIA
jgi:hypothetical protein